MPLVDISPFSEKYAPVLGLSDEPDENGEIHYKIPVEHLLNTEQWTAHQIRTRIGKCRSIVKYLYKVGLDNMAVRLEEYISRLDILIFNGHPPLFLYEIGIDSWDMTCDDLRWHFGLEKCYYSKKGLKEMYRVLENNADSSRVSGWNFRSRMECDEKLEKGWYPFFVTLTCNPKKKDPEYLLKHTNEFYKWKKNLYRMVLRADGYTNADIRDNVDLPKMHECLSCMRVVEHGTDNNHHLHVLLYLKNVPTKWKQCPNKARENFPNYKECFGMKKYWKWGFTTARHMFVQSNEAIDPWRGKHDFILPVEKNGKRVKKYTPKGIGNYLTKYMTKEAKKWRHRIHATKDYGLCLLKRELMKLDHNQLRILMNHTGLGRRCRRRSGLQRCL